MAGDYTYKIHIDRLDAVGQLLADHYGLGISFFARDWDKENDFIELDFPCSDEDFLSCFKSEREFINKKGELKLKKSDLPNTPENKEVIDAIWLMVNVCTREDLIKEQPVELLDYVRMNTPKFDDDEDYQSFMELNYSDFLCDFYERESRKDLLELYIYHKCKHYLKDESSEITIKYGNGKRKLKLENKDNWFEKVLLSNHFDKYLPDIKSEQEAIDALNVIKHPGRKLVRPLLYHFLYGTYSLISTHLGKQTVTESFCELMLTLLEQMDYPLTYMYSSGQKKGEVKDIDSQYIRKMVSKLKMQAENYKLDMGLVLQGEEALKALKKSGRSLYDKMI